MGGKENIKYKTQRLEENKILKEEENQKLLLIFAVRNIKHRNRRLS